MADGEFRSYGEALLALCLAAVNGLGLPELPLNTVSLASLTPMETPSFLFVSGEVFYLVTNSPLYTFAVY